MTEQTVNYLMSGDAHAPYLIVSLNSLRRYYDGPVTVWAYPESLATSQAIACDKYLGISVKLWEPSYRGKNGQFLNKLYLMESLKSKCNLYLDADTMICSNLDPIFFCIERYGFVATQFNDWVSNAGVVKKRIAALVGRSSICQVNVKKAMTNLLPSVNGGVFGCKPDSIVLDTWQQWTESVLDVFIADETCLHVIVARYLIDNFEAESTGFDVMVGGKWNCSPKYQPASVLDSDVKIWHFHGDSNVRPQKSQKGYDLWWPEFQKCLDENIGFVHDWLAGAVEQNKHLKEVMK